MTRFCRNSSTSGSWHVIGDVVLAITLLRCKQINLPSLRSDVEPLLVEEAHVKVVPIFLDQLIYLVAPPYSLSL